MKRSPLPPRRAVLARSSWVRRPARRTSEETRTRGLVAARSAGRCELHLHAHPANDMHHRQNRSQGGLWAASNLLHICREAHRWITTHPVEARARGWALRSTDNPLTGPAWHARHGWVLLDDAGSWAPVGEVAA